MPPTKNKKRPDPNVAALPASGHITAGTPRKKDPVSSSIISVSEVVAQNPASPSLCPTVTIPFEAGSRTIRCTFLVDTGAEANFLPLGDAQAIQANIADLMVPLHIRLWANQSSSRTVSKSCQVPIHLDAHELNTNFYIVDASGINILSAPWLAQHKITVNLHDRHLRIEGTSESTALSVDEISSVISNANKKASWVDDYLELKPRWAFL